MTLDDAIQLHETLEVTYVVDAYLAVLYTADRKIVAFSAEGDTVGGAIRMLRKRLSDVPDIKALRELCD